MRSGDGPERGRGEGREAAWTPARVEGKPRVAHRRSVTTSAQAAHPSPVCEHAVSLAPLRHLRAKCRRCAAVALRNAPAGAVLPPPNPLRWASAGTPYALSRREQRAKTRSTRKGHAASVRRQSRQRLRSTRKGHAASPRRGEVTSVMRQSIKQLPSGRKDILWKPLKFVI